MRFEHGLGVAHGKADAHGHHERHVEDRALPRLRIERALRRQIKTGNRAARRDEQRQVDEQHLEPALIEAHDHRGQQQRRENHHEGIADVGGEVKDGLGLDVRGLVRAQHARQDFLRRLHQALGPARLLRLERVHFHGQLGGAFDIRQIEKFPADEAARGRKDRCPR